MKRILGIIQSINSGKTPKINPTIIFNEGWMTRLLVELSIQRGLKVNKFDFSQFKNWTSEALISSPFIQAPHTKEGYTHVDIAIGDFIIDYKTRGELQIDSTAENFGIIEAKMRSNLSQATKNASYYNQATRNIVCIAKNTLDIDCKTFFAVAAPKKIIKSYKFDNQIELGNVLDQLNIRFSGYDNQFRDLSREKEINNKIKSMTIFTISYEEWIDAFSGKHKKELESFYKKTLLWNRL